MNFDLNKEDPMQHLLITLKDEPTGNDTQWSELEETEDTEWY
jgi:hypothetical protein